MKPKNPGFYGSHPPACIDPLGNGSPEAIIPILDGPKISRGKRNHEVDTHLLLRPCVGSTRSKYDYNSEEFLSTSTAAFISTVQTRLELYQTFFFQKSVSNIRSIQRLLTRITMESSPMDGFAGLKPAFLVRVGFHSPS
jgi:hypothetical protein